MELDLDVLAEVVRDAEPWMCEDARSVTLPSDVVLALIERCRVDRKALEIAVRIGTVDDAYFDANIADCVRNARRVLGLPAAPDTGGDP